jgi:hypothetical protein
MPVLVRLYACLCLLLLPSDSTGTDSRSPAIWAEQKMEKTRHALDTGGGAMLRKSRLNGSVSARCFVATTNKSFPAWSHEYFYARYASTN